MRYPCDKHKSQTALWICTDCDSLYCSACVEKRIVSQRGKKKTFYFCPKCNIETERLSSNPLKILFEKIEGLFHQAIHPPGKKTEPQKHEGTLLNRIDTLIEDGNVDDALALIERERDAISSDINLSERYFNILKMKDKTSDMLEHGRTYLDQLAKSGSMTKLHDVFLECLSRSSDFSASSAASFKIAASMIESGNPKAASEVYERFIKNNPEDPMTPKASFLAANLFNERLLDRKKAVELLENIVKKYPHHEITTYARQYLGQIKK